tara:strand:+ start:198 stop:392 length:195 start_codon:yes stop_codon:yes gene_type:complete
MLKDEKSKLYDIMASVTNERDDWKQSILNLPVENLALLEKNKVMQSEMDDLKNNIANLQNCVAN